MKITLGQNLRDRARVYGGPKGAPTSDSWCERLGACSGKVVEVQHVHLGVNSKAPEVQGRERLPYAYTVKLPDGLGVVHVPALFCVEDRPAGWTAPVHDGRERHEHLKRLVKS